ncbi:hypothetical protein BC938DRAFT_480751 [Jimgerdemannia flammicorona]|uniref:Nuclear pore protein n=1 Tax=Jimgerdemannia flammicorona TaxID=994334 RepID=A0A433QHY4_9FUNG|nr:hypothetical protein BC938DRAFT_480751 [Jimgerdemannia flammicorona]
MAAPASLKQLLEQSRRLTNHIAPNDLPQIERGLDQIESQSRKLVAKATRAGEGLDTRAYVSSTDADLQGFNLPVSSSIGMKATRPLHYFLAGGGINAQELSQNLNSINLTTTFEPLQPIHDTDIEGYLRHEHEQIIVSAIEEGRRETLRDFDEGFERALHLDWERSKKKIFEELGQHQGQDVLRSTGYTTGFATGAGHVGGIRDSGTAFASPMPFGSSLRDVTSAGPGGVGGLHMHTRMMRYDKVVRTLNDYRLRDANYAIVHAFADVAKSLAPEAKSQQMVDCWRLLASVVNEQHAINGIFQRQALNEGQYAREYLESPYDSPQAIELRKGFIDGARTFLEEQFKLHVERTVEQNPAEASLGGVPSINNKIRAFMNIKFKRLGVLVKPNLEFANDTPIWAHIYNLLRAGHAEEALDFAINNEAYLQKMERSFLVYFRAYMENGDRRVPKNIRDRLLSDYNQRIRYATDSDPYKLALYKILGRCELNKKTLPEVASSTEDYVWLQLMLIRETSEFDAAPHDRYNLCDLQRSMVKFGPSHFNPRGNNPIHYAQVLLLTAQFERAVHYLYQTDQYQLEAVHLAIALAYYGLLRIPSEPLMADADLCK